MFVYTSLCSPVFGHSCGLDMLLASIAMQGFLPVVSGWEEGCGRLSRLLGHVHHVPDALRDMRLADGRFVLVTRSPDSRVVRVGESRVAYTVWSWFVSRWPSPAGA